MRAWPADATGRVIHPCSSGAWPLPAQVGEGPWCGGYARQLRSFLAEMYDFHAANQRLHHLLFHAAEVSEDEPLEQARAALARFVTRGAQAGELTVDDPEETASFLLDGLHGLLLRSLHAGRSRRDFTGAAWSLCARLLAITT
jgi:AcrR family transcriptional regulator